jgi:hypothetical protein
VHRGTPVAGAKESVRMTNNSQQTGSGSDRGAFSNSPSSSTSSNSGQVNYDTPAIQVGNQVRDGDEFVLLVRNKQSNGFQAWSSGDKNTTSQLMQQAQRQLNIEPATT